MKYMWIALLAAVLAYLEYTRGIIYYKHKIAVAFVGRRGKNSWTSSYTACTGVVKFGCVFEEGRYDFVLDTTDESGSVQVEIIRRGETLAVLTPEKKKAVLTLPKGRCTIATRYRKASGNLELVWNKH